MNRSLIRYILGYVLNIESILLLLPAVTGWIYRETSAWYYLSVAGACAIMGVCLTIRKPKNTTLYVREGYVITALCWIFLSFFGCLPLWISGAIPSFVDALFETISGFTTTGASILSDVESLDYCHLFWRSFTHWIGGMGVLVFLLMILPMNGGSHMNLMRAESPGPSVSKLVPKIKTTARILYLIYFGLTVLECVLLLCGKMPVFDAICTSFATAGTGGFGIKNDSIGGYSPYIQWVVTIFMLLFGVNFTAYYLILFGKVKNALKMEEVRYYFAIVFCSIVIIFSFLLRTATSIESALRDASFQVASIISSTGFSTADFNQWSETSRAILVMLMFIGACAGSTGGGIKVSRIIILAKTLGKELRSYIHPKAVQKVKFEGKAVEHEVLRATNVYVITFLLIFSGSLLIVSFDDKDLITTFTAVIATFNNIGPGLEAVGPTQNFGSLSNLSKLVLAFDMLAGRLELFPMLMLFHPSLWTNMFKKFLPKRKQKNLSE